MPSWETCKFCGLPVVIESSTSVYGGTISYGCARCLLDERDELKKILSECAKEGESGGWNPDSPLGIRVRELAGLPAAEQPTRKIPVDSIVYLLARIAAENPEGIRLAAQLLGVPSCPSCDRIVRPGHFCYNDPLVVTMPDPLSFLDKMTPKERSERFGKNAKMLQESIDQDPDE